MLVLWERDLGLGGRGRGDGGGGGLWQAVLCWAGPGWADGSVNLSACLECNT